MKTKTLLYPLLGKLLLSVVFLLIISFATGLKAHSQAMQPHINNGYASVKICDNQGYQLSGGGLDLEYYQNLSSVCQVVGYTVQWLNSGWPVSTGSFGYTAYQSGVYSLRITYHVRFWNFLGCGFTQDIIYGSPGKLIEVTYHPTSFFANVLSSQPSCPGSTVTLSAVANFNGNSTAGFHWYEGGCGTLGNYIGTGSSKQVNPTVTTTYFVRIQSNCGNTFCIPLTVNVNPLAPPTAATANPSAICPGSSSTLTVHGVASGTHTIQWFSDAALTQLISTGQFPIVSPTTTTTYYVRYLYFFCGASSIAVPVTVTVNQLNAYIIDQSDVSCNGGNDGELEIGVFTNNSGPVTLEYSLDGGATPQYSNLFTGLTEGIHTITVINPATGCTTSIDATITEPAQPVSVSVSNSSSSCNGTNSGTASANASGGTPGYTYEWENAQGLKVSLTNPATGLGSGSYTVIATDANGCTSTSTVTINELDPINVELGDDKVVFFGALGFNGCHTLSPTVSGATGDLTYVWTSTDPNIANASTNGNSLSVCVGADIAYDYTMTVTDENGCTGSATVNVIYANIDCSSQQNAGKVTICRIPPGNPSNCQTICVAINAAQAILDLGGYVGPCLPNCAQPAARMVSSAPASSSKELNIHPNPASSSVHINYISDTNDAEIILITDLQGRIVEKINIKGAFEFSGNVDISNYDNGIYFINIMNNSSVIKTAKLVKAE